MTMMDRDDLELTEEEALELEQASQGHQEISVGPSEAFSAPEEDLDLGEPLETAETTVWEQQEGESPQAFEAFRTYRDMGAARSTAKVARSLGKTKALMDRWSSAKDWVERAIAYDKEQDRLFLAEQAEARKEMARRHAALAGLMQRKLLDRIRNLRPSKLSPQDVAKWLDVAAKVERLAREASTENHGLVAPGGGESMLSRIVFVEADGTVSKDVREPEEEDKDA